MDWGPMTTVPAPEGLTRGAAASTAGGSRATARATQPVTMTHIRLVGERGGKRPFLSPRGGGGLVTGSEWPVKASPHGESKGGLEMRRISLPAGSSTAIWLVPMSAT